MEVLNSSVSLQWFLVPMVERRYCAQDTVVRELTHPKWNPPSPSTNLFGYFFKLYQWLMAGTRMPSIDKYGRI
jgi:hypothetical protein